MESLVVTGGAGFIGSNFVHWVIQHTDVRVIVLDAMTYAANPRSLTGLPGDRCTVVPGSITDANLVDDLVGKADAVVNFAAESHNDNSLRNPEPFLTTNIMGTYTVLEAVRRHHVRFHQVSTDEVFGPLGMTDPPVTADAPYRPSSPYSASKASADHLVRAWVRSFGVAATTSCCTNNYGPRQHVEKFIARQITTILDGHRPKLYGDGRHIRDWIHVTDHARAIWTILHHGRVGQTYLVSAENQASNLEVVHLILDLMGHPMDDYDLVADRPGHDLRYALDCTRTREELGWHPQYTDLRAGLADTIDWYRANEAWWRPDKAATEASYARTGQ